MSKLPLVAYADLRKIVEECGYAWQRTVGSHNTFRNPQGRIIVLPDHGSHVIVRPLLRRILHDLGLSTDAYTALLKRVK